MRLLTKLLPLIFIFLLNIQPALSQIVTRKYNSTVIRRSLSNRVYLLKSDSTMPEVGRVFLLLKEKKHVKAFRVLKQYQDTNQFAAKQVRQYPQFRILESDSIFNSIEKTGVVNPIPLTTEDALDLGEIAPEVKTEQIPLDPNPTPPEKVISKLPDTDPELSNDLEKARETTKEEVQIQDNEIDDLEDASQLVVEEVDPIDPFYNSFGAEIGFLKNKNISDTNSYYLGVGARYSLKLVKNVFIGNRETQDHFSLDLAAFTYEIQNFTGSGDAFNVIPLYLGLRYTVLSGDVFAWFLSGGGLYNYLAAYSPITAKTENGATFLKGFVPGFGVGFLFTLGPNWEWRIDLSNELLGSGLSLRY